MNVLRKYALITFLGFFFILSFAHAVTTPIRGSASYWKTDKFGSIFVEKQSDLHFGATSGNSYLTIHPNPSNKKQEIDGFGGSMTHASAYLINNHSLRDSIIKKLFDPLYDGGIGANFVRIPIGASDYSLNWAIIPPPAGPYGGQNDLSHTFDMYPVGAYAPAGPFSAQDDQSRPLGISPFADLNSEDLYTNPAHAIDKDIIEVIQDGLSYNPHLLLIAVPWSAPTRWKTGVSPSFVGGSLNPQYEDEYADYFADFVEFYLGHGLYIWAISIQNEPLNTGNTPSMGMDSIQAARIAIELDKEFTARGLDTKIIAFEHNMEDDDYPRQFFKELKSSQDGLLALARVVGTGWHVYDEDQDGDNEIERMGDFQNELRSTIGIEGMKSWITERTGSNPISFSGDAWWFWKEVTYPSLINEASGILWWNFMLDEEGGPNLVNGDIYRSRGMFQLNADNSISNTAEAAIIGHFSKFLKPGSYMLSESGMTQNIYYLSFVNPDGSIVVVLRSHNWQSRKVEVQMHSKSIELTLDPNSFATLIFDQPGYSGWLSQTSNGLFENNLGKQDDLDGDGLSNLLEYALDTNPMLANKEPPLSLNYEESLGTYDLSFHVGQYTEQMNYTLKTSPDLNIWETVPFTGNLIPGTQYTQPVDSIEAGEGTRFFQLWVNEL